ncbi:MAG: GIDE domain-containing protein [Candidatus Sulfotelmatobacter sp.]
MICTGVFLSILLLRSSDSRPIAWCVIGVFAGLYIFYKGFLLLQRRHLILDTPVSKVRSASLGMVELNGLATGPYTMLAPITERPCYYHRTVAWEWKQRGKNKQWVKVAAECMHVPFFLDDNTGKVMVDPRDAELDLHRDFQQEFCDGFFTTKQEAPPNVHNFLLRYGISTRNKIKVEEFCIKPKNALFVLGTLDENPGLEVTSQPVQIAEPATAVGIGTSSFSLGGTALSFLGRDSSFGGSSSASFSGNGRSEDDRLLEAVLNKPASDGPGATAVSQVIHLSPAAAPANATEMTQQQKVAAALVKAGITNPAAWAAARVAPTPIVRRSDVNGIAQPATLGPDSPTKLPDGFEQHPRVVLMKGTNNPTFIISWRSQRDLASSLGWKCTLMIWGGPALTILCLYALHNMTHWF